MKLLKFVILFFLFFLSFNLISCDNGEDTLATTPSPQALAEELMESVASQINIPNASALESNFNLPQSFSSVNISWVSGNADIVIISGTTVQTAQGLKYPVVLNRPLESDATVTLTATFSYGEYSYQKDYSVTVKAEVGLDDYSSIADLHTNAVKDDYVQVSGYVFSIIKNGYFMVDTSGVVVEISTTPENAALIDVGDEVLVKGTYSTLYSLYYIKNLTVQVVLSTDNAVQVEPYVLASANSLLDIEPTDKTAHGQYYQTTVTPKTQTVAGVTNIFFYCGDEVVAKLSTITRDDSKAVIENHLNHDITIDLLYFYYDQDDQMLSVVFDGLESDVVVVSTHEGEAELAADVAALTIPLIVDAPLTSTLPSVGENGSVITWESGDTGVATVTGNSVSYLNGEATASVTLTATITYNALTPVTKMFTVQVNSPTSLSDIAAIATGTVVAATGKVYLILDSGFFIKDDTGTLGIYTNAVPTVALGDTVTVTGTTAVYGTLVQLSTITSTTVVSSGAKEVPYATLYEEGMTLEPGKLYRVSCTVKYETSYYNLYQGATKIGSIYSKSPAAALEVLSEMVDTTVTLELYYYTYLSSSSLHLFAFDNFAAALTDSEKVDRDLHDLMVPETAYLNKSISLPDFGFYGTVFSYSVDVPGAVNINPGDVMTLITFLSAGDLVLSVGGTKNAVNFSKTFDLSVVNAEATTIPNVYSGTVGANVLVQGIITGFNGTEGFFLQDASGNGIYVNGSPAGLAIGNQVMVSATISEQTGLAHSWRYLGGTASVIENDLTVHTLIEKSFSGTNMVSLFNDSSILGSLVAIDSLVVDHYVDDTVFFLLTTIETAPVYLKAEIVNEEMKTIYPAASTISLAKMIIYGYDGNHLIGHNLVVPDYTDNQKATLAIAEIPSEMNVSTSLELPTLPYGTVSSVTVSESLTGCLSYASGQFTVVSPASLTTGSIVVTVTVGSVSKEKTVQITVAAASSTIPTDLFISEYVEGSSLNKYLEIYNGTGAAIDLSAYTLELYSNGAVTASTTLTLSGILASGTTLIVRHAEATLSFTNVNGVTISNSTVANWNGDDAIVLKHNGTIIDSFGQVGVRPSPEPWKDMTLVRKPNIIAGRTDATAAFDFTSEWISYPKDDLSNLGTHTIE